jgi:hypothetical protein
MSQAAPDAWDAARARVAALIARRAAILDETAGDWARFARSAGWTAADLDALWDGLTEDLVRRYGHASHGDARTVRADVLATMTALRERIVRELSP